jgi:hypothetical protein
MLEEMEYLLTEGLASSEGWTALKELSYSELIKGTFVSVALFVTGIVALTAKMALSVKALSKCLISRR